MYMFIDPQETISKELADLRPKFYTKHYGYAHTVYSTNLNKQFSEFANKNFFSLKTGYPYNCYNNNLINTRTIKISFITRYIITDLSQ